MARPKPTLEYLNLTGQQYRDRSNAATPSQHEGGRPSCPSYLSAEGKKEFRRVVKILAARGTLTAGDGPAIEVYVELVLRWRVCLKEIAEHGAIVEEQRGSPSGAEWITRTENPACKMAAKLEAQIRQYQKELGITPAAREKAKRVAPGYKKPVVGSDEWILEEAAAGRYQFPATTPEPAPTSSVTEEELNVIMEAL